MKGVYVNGGWYVKADKVSPIHTPVIFYTVAFPHPARRRHAGTPALCPCVCAAVL